MKSSISVGRTLGFLHEGFPKLKTKKLGQNLWVRGYFDTTIKNVKEGIIRNYIVNQSEDE
ncbi:transposase [Peribacillus loiseleuriae]|uniref:transposase n=1 Tax=Peribacillus loiseleuriae TaxID=1679170 RepID=UPI003CFF9C62